MDTSDGRSAGTTQQTGEHPAPAEKPVPVDTGAQEQAGQDRAEGGGYT